MKTGVTFSGEASREKPSDMGSSSGTTVSTKHSTRIRRGRLLGGRLGLGFDSSTPRWAAWVGTAAALVGAALIVTTAAIHLHLWLTGYRHVPRLGPLFLAQAITGLLLGPIVALIRQAALLLTGAGFMAASAVGLILSATVGFVGIHDGLDVPWATPSLAIELAGFLLLSAASAFALAPLLRRDA